MVYISGSGLQVALYTSIPAFANRGGAIHKLAVAVVNIKAVKAFHAGQYGSYHIVVAIPIWRKTIGHKNGWPGFKNLYEYIIAFCTTNSCRCGKGV